MEFNGNVAVEAKSAEAEKLVTDWRVSHDTDFSELNFVTMIDMLASAIDKAGSTDPLKVALALEDMHARDMDGQGKHHAQGRPSIADAVLRRHLQQGCEVRTPSTPAFGWKNYMTATAADLTLPTICKMKRPE